MSEIEFPVGEYVNSRGDRSAVVAVLGVYRWATTEAHGDEPRTYHAHTLRLWDIKPYVPPVVVEQALYISLSCRCAVETSYTDQYGGTPVKFTFHDGKLVKAEVDE